MVVIVLTILLIALILDALGTIIFRVGSSKAADSKDRFLLTLISIRFMLFVLNRILLMGLVFILWSLGFIQELWVQGWLIAYSILTFASIITLSVFLGTLIYEQVKGE